MSLDIHSNSQAQVRAVEIPAEANAGYQGAQIALEYVESGLVVLASGLAAILISAIWVSLSLG